jgi:hypothetical protein
MSCDEALHLADSALTFRYGLLVALETIFESIVGFGHCFAELLVLPKRVELAVKECDHWDDADGEAAERGEAG